jgi:2'-5' RNA ligase
MAKRLFIALELPENCRKTLSALNPHVKGLRWLPEEQLHVTLSFVGQANVPEEERLRDELATVHVPAFFLPIQGIGTFGGARPTVVWVGLGKGHPHLYALHKHIQDAVFHAGLEPDLKPFHSHITLGRASGVSGATLLPFLRRHSDGPIHTLEMRREF